MFEMVHKKELKTHSKKIQLANDRRRQGRSHNELERTDVVSTVYIRKPYSFEILVF